MKTLLFLDQLIAPFIKAKVVVKAFSSVKGVFMVPLAVSAISIDVVSSLYVLFSLLIFDFGTGIAASYFDKKKAEKLDPELKKKNLISSEKLKMSGVKFLLYTLTILCAYFIEKIFFIKSFNFSFSEANFTISVIVIGFWCVVEFYSIFFENFKRMGIDIVELALKFFRKYKSVKKEVNSIGVDYEEINQE